LINECVDSAQINGEFVLEKLLDELHGDGSSSKIGRVHGSEWSLPSSNSYASSEKTFVWGMCLKIIKSDYCEDSRAV
jgi:hypothetical protein